MAFDYDDEEWKETLRLLREELHKARGYANYWCWRLDPARAEKRAAEVLHNYFVRIGQAPSGSLSKVAKDPPDLVLLEEGGNRRIGIEVTELVDSETVRRHHQRKQRGETPIFEFAYWTPERIAVELNKRIAAKDAKLRDAASLYHEMLLVIVTDEKMIDETFAHAAVALCGAPMSNNIDRAFFILSYHPATDKGTYPDKCAVFPIPLVRAAH